MTQWFTDSPGATAGLLPDGVPWGKTKQREVHGDIASAYAADGRIRAAAIEGEAARGERTVVLIDRADRSQFDRTLDLLRDGRELPDVMICAALTGSGFRGQRNRPWSACRGNLHLTALYRIDRPMAGIQAALTMLPAVAAADVAGNLLGKNPGPSIKWVNDILLNGRKVAGVLTATTLSGEVVDRAVFGVGMNVGTTPEIPVSPFVPAATCLADHDPALCDALPAVFRAVVEKLDGLVAMLLAGRADEIFRRYASRAGFIGREVRIWPEDTETGQGVETLAEGRVESLNPDLSLTIAGMTEPVRRGRMAFEEHCRRA